MARLTCSLFFFLIITAPSFSQTKLEQFLQPSDTLNTSRRTAVYISEGAIGGLTLIGLHQLWYADYQQSNFHTINDNSEWLQIDKMGHVFSSYQLGRLGANALAWSGASKSEQLPYGATLGFTFLSAVEVLDGFSKEWGFSWGDMLANASGAGFYIGQEVLWHEQRIALKYSFHQTKYAEAQPDKALGDGFLEELLKDYNGQTYWLSFNMHAFIKNDHIPKWLNVAVGYGADGMMFGNSGVIDNNITGKNRARQFYLSLDVDLSRIETKSPLLRTVFDVLNVIKVPFPTVEFAGKNGVKLHGVYF
ncbi:DUF2279 domain-containing protein [Gelidibacter salicanalis]|uniref:DUF2279 domain-containing protein n=1 Tax=Gelidibacter salicanalis TaxID=291193 RepID=A0A934KWE8_9FLAO|nr:DUF2279 domain-containing protein [Gelidibacter salicanalis]MBJ7880600.1 DUF2279 domain-containing protein [Gelidibacter salicanalis]